MGGLIAAGVPAELMPVATGAAEPVPAVLHGLDTVVDARDSDEAGGAGAGAAFPPAGDPAGFAPPDAGLIGAKAGGAGAAVADGADATGELAGAAGAAAGVLDGLGLLAGASELTCGPGGTAAGELELGAVGVVMTIGPGVGQTGQCTVVVVKPWGM